MFCTNCGRPMEDENLGCRFCKDLPKVEFNFCQHCGEKIVGDSSICSQCEEKIKKQKNYEKNTATQKEETDDDVINKTISYIKKRSLISMIMWVVVTALEVVAVVFYSKLYPLYAAPLFNILLFVRSFQYYTNADKDIKNVVRTINKRMENAEILSGCMLLLGLVVGGIPAYFDLKTQKEVLIKKREILK